VSSSLTRRQRLRRRADAITARLLYGDEPRIDLDIAMNALRDWVEQVMPDRLDLFDMIYVARWDRLRAQGWEHPRPYL
jgi:hypothetical protein